MKPRVFVTFQKEARTLFLLLAGTAAAALWGLNGGAYAEELRYMLVSMSAEGAPSSSPILSFPPPVVAPDIGADQRSYVLTIPKIGITAPIVNPASEDPKDVLASLEQGVGRYPHSSFPGVPGRTVLLGHSSRASWYRGGYATVFTLIKELRPGDAFSIAASDRVHTYEVYARREMSPDDANHILASPVDGSEVVLLTCFPIGSASRRMVVSARLVRTEYVAVR